MPVPESPLLAGSPELRSHRASAAGRSTRCPQLAGMAGKHCHQRSYLLAKVLKKIAPECKVRSTFSIPDYYAVPAFVKASMASDNVGNISRICSSLVISNTFSTRLLTPVSAMRRPALAHDVQALTSDPRPEESR